jgi:hypothetical protein
MKTANGHGNGKGNTKNPGVRFTTEVIEANPYLQRPEDDISQAAPLGEEEIFDGPITDEDSSPVEHDDEGKKTRQRRRRMALATVAAVFLVAMICVVALYYRNGTRVEYGRPGKGREVIPPPPNVTATPGRDTRTDRAIEEAQRMTAGGEQTTLTITSPRIGTEVSPNSAPSPDQPFTEPTGFTNTVKSSPEGLETKSNKETSPEIERGSAITQSDGTPSNKTIRSQRSSETSLYMADATAEQKMQSASGAQANRKSLLTRESNTEAIFLPAFGSMLPVRTIGAVYTLRTGALVRLELTRDARGNGWSMKRGTILVGTTKGSDLDRAYVSILGFIDSQTGKLLKLGGEVRGGDGGDGLKGKRRQLDSGWVRALGRVSGAALDVTGALLSGRSRDTVIISDGLRTRAINPVTDELNGVLGGELNRRQGRGFVEVVAGTPGYVMVTDLPAILKGTEANPELDNKSLALLTDVDAARSATGISECELADLLANGSPEEIRAAMPRMTSEMRKIAAAVLPP